MSRLLRVLTALFALVFAVDAFAAGYSCPTYKKYTSCASGYYMTKGGTYNGTPVAGNACTSCPSGYTCAGGTADKKISTVTCSAGQYINGTTCKTCEAGYRCNGQTTYTPNGGVQGRTACSGSTEYQNSTGQTSCKAVSTGYYKSSNTAQTQCPSGYQVGAGAANQNSCVGNFTKTGSQIAPTAVPTNCKAITASGSCTPGTCTYKKNYAGTITSNCTATNCTKPITGVSAKTGYRTNGTTCTACPSGYPNSADGNTGGITKCYSNSKSRGWSGGQTACSKPSNAYSVTCNSCSGSACTYVAYSNSAGNGDGTIKSGCSSNSANCQQSVKSVTCNANYRVNGTSCTACPSGYPNSAANNSGGITACYSNNKSRAWSGGQTACGKPSNCASVTCNSCSRSACTYVAYSNSAGTGDGTIKSGCSSNSANCQQSVKSVTANAGYYANGTACTICPAGKYCTGGTAAAANCAAGTYRSTTGGTAASSCSACTGATYSGAGATGCTNCPSGYTANTSNNKTAASQCQINVAAGKFLSTVNTTTTGTCSAGTYKAAHTVNYGSTSSCAVCGTNTYSNAQAGSCTACATGNKYYNSGTAAANHAGVGSCVVSCAAGTYVASGGAACTSVGTGYYRAAHTVAQGSTSTRTQCPANYRAGAATGAESGCAASCAAGQYVPTAKAACTSVGTGYYRAAHTVTYGNTSTRTQCPANYRAGAATGAESGCAASCAAGQYVPTAKAACTSVGTGYYRAAHTVTYGNTSTRTQCPDGYRNGGATGAESSCVMAVAAGKYVATGKSATQTSCAAGTSKAAHNVTYGNTSSCAACTGATYSGAGAGSCTNCPSGYTANTASNKTAASQCQISVAGGKYVATANSATLTTCDAGYACPGGNVNYGSTGARNKCTGVTYSGAGASACTTCPNSATGYYIAGDIHTTINSCYKNVPWTGSHGNGTRNCYYTSGTGTSAVYSSSCDAYKASKCAAAYYYVSGADCTSVGTGYWSAADSIIRTQCPANYQVGAAATAQSGCKTNCAAGTRVATANAACSAITSGNVYMLAHSVNYGATSAAATACPTGYSISGTTAADHDAKNDCKISCGAGTRVASADAVCTTPSGNWYVGAHTVAAGSTSSVNSCLANYTISGTAATNHDAASDCRISCGAGTRIVSANATSCTTPSGNWYVGAHTVPQGSTSSVNSCLANYSISGTAATNHDAAADCKISCSGGTYIAAANNTSCSNVGAGYWAAASTVSQGSAGARNQCASGLTTIGYGAGADEAGDCGRILNVGTDKVYLRSTKKTTPSLNIKIGDQTYYGNMSTATKGTLRIKNGTTTYSVHDDSK